MIRAPVWVTTPAISMEYHRAPCRNRPCHMSTATSTVSRLAHCQLPCPPVSALSWSVLMLPHFEGTVFAHMRKVTGTWV